MSSCLCLLPHSLLPVTTCSRPSPVTSGSWSAWKCGEGSWSQSEHQAEAEAVRWRALLDLHPDGVFRSSLAVNCHVCFIDGSADGGEAQRDGGRKRVQRAAAGDRDVCLHCKGGIMRLWVRRWHSSAKEPTVREPEQQEAAWSTASCRDSQQEAACTPVSQQLAGTHVTGLRHASLMNAAQEA